MRSVASSKAFRCLPSARHLTTKAARAASTLSVAPSPKSKPEAASKKPDVLIVGGGIIGCSTAYHLALRGASVTVVDTRGIAASQSSKSWGFCRQQGRDLRELELMRESMKRWRVIEAELGYSVGWQAAGNLALCDSEKRYNQFKKWMPQAAVCGLDTRMLDDKEVKELLPGLAGTWMGGVWTPSDGSADPASATLAFAKAAEERGVNFRLFSPVVKDLIVENGVTKGIKLADGTAMHAGTVVVAAGAWTSELIGNHFALPQLRVRATAAQTEKLVDLGQEYKDFPAIGVWAPRVSFRKRLDGTMTIADAGYAEEHEFEVYASTRYGWKFLPGYFKNPITMNVVHDITHRRDPNPNPRRIDQASSSFEKMFPNLPQLRIKETWAGHIDMTPDMVPVIDCDGGLPKNLVVSTGYSGHGLGIAPGAGRLTADMTLSLTRPEEARAFRVDRFGEKLFFEPESVF
mmetsp:Transcript_89772/g.187573  ORF Transcript_89772/g.187573 Transcript_89772/m.187573 type:complete len:461 (-) Transcript_89772:414-1796(-)|eukprot:CAMPEP_0206468468 /NCGR_PEP_ID=MMETSP0324_2-20121206/29648_1 /ASSEMBLY_ACC=CAM_ASM_000836 /TAXON_ID=2866 /ORGANISM="Crypthecodinium cohnii, Strain Seligo" /LENGTH=460 /DNA_ID=CAMNT_0053941933 /DNA_START=88 /DNA_END=1470 /DNA_ORIENTATION=+